MKNVEIERKFLLKPKATKKFLKSEKSPILKQDIIQAYLDIGSSKEKRIRRSDNKFHFTEKIGKGIKRKETEYEITKSEYKDLLKKHVGILIQKNRYLFSMGSCDFSIDIYKKKLKGMAVLEVEFKTMDDMRKFKMPKKLKDIIKKEVSKDIRYKNGSLAIFGAPKHFHYELKSIYDRIDKIDIKSFLFELNPKMDSFGALRVIFYYYLKQIEKYRDLMLCEDDIEHLHQFRVNTRKTRALLSEMGMIFDKDIVCKIKENFKATQKVSNLKRDIDVYIENINEFSIGKDEACMEKFSKYLWEKGAEEELKVKVFAQSPEYKHMMDEWRLVLSEESDFYLSDKSKIYIYLTSKEKILNRYKKICSKINDLQKNFHTSDLHRIRIFCKKLRYMLESFKSLFKKKNVERIILDLKEFQTTLGDFNDYENQQHIIKDFLDQRDDQLSDDERISFENILQDLNDKQQQSAEEARKLFDLFLKDAPIYDKLFG